jgi:anaerobic selenocysteine-containing dehydrogenase
VSALAKVALGAMLSIATPGAGKGSRIELADEPVPAELAEGVTFEPPGFKLSRVTWTVWTRTESTEESLERWATIALADAAVAANPPAEWHWRGADGRLQLVRALVTIARHESAFWRSVHEGRLRGAAGEACLVQIHPDTARRLGIDLDSLVGIDQAATERCLRAGAIVLAMARELAECRCQAAPHWFAPSIAAYGSGAGCVPEGSWVKGVEERVVTYARTGFRRPLGDDALALLGDG